MINIKEIEEEIEKLKNCDCTTYDVCKKLAILYIVHDHLTAGNTTDMRSSAPMMSSSPMR